MAKMGGPIGGGGFNIPVTDNGAPMGYDGKPMPGWGDSNPMSMDPSQQQNGQAMGAPQPPKNPWTQMYYSGGQ
jgi:hypothetical protein